MKVMRGNVLLQYSLVTLAVTGAVSVLMGFALARQTTMYEMETHARLYPEIVRMAVISAPGLPDLLSGPPGMPIDPENEQVLRSLLTLGGVYRVKAWSSDLRIIWSDQRDLVGQSFPDDAPCLTCLKTDKVVAEMVEPSAPENIDERTAGLSLEIYTPVHGPDGRHAGVIEVYEANAELFSQISRATRFVWLSVGAGAVVLYGLLFVVFLRSWRHQKRAAEQLFETQEVTIRALARQADLRDEMTGRHLERTARYVRALAERLAQQSEFRGYLTREYIDDLTKSAPLHDIGKVGVKDSILLKPGPLTAEETAEMRRHCEFGAHVLLEAQRDLHEKSFLTLASQLAMSHHEHWDGTGYPRGLKGEDIPLSARIMALADVYDALRTRRSYKPALSHGETTEIIRGLKGTQLDPRIVQAFLDRREEFLTISCELADVPSCQESPVPNPGSAPYGSLNGGTRILLHSQGA
jgi:hypothetical protein